MARGKGSKNKTKKTQNIDPTVEEIVIQEIEFICPVRGKVKQKVKIKRLKKGNGETRPIINASDAIDALDREDDGLTMYDESDEDVE
jgi:translation elongation factor P/translation initiation factor 5A